jgi:hypothetical protein
MNRILLQNIQIVSALLGPGHHLKLKCLLIANRPEIAPLLYLRHSKHT